MGKILELSDDTYAQLVGLAQQQQRTPEEMLRGCLATYEAARYARVHQQMIAEGLLAALPTRPLPPEVEAFDPTEIPGPPIGDDSGGAAVMPAYVDTSALVKRYVTEIGSAWGVSPHLEHHRCDYASVLFTPSV